MFTPAEVTNTGRLLALVGTGLWLADWHPLVGVASCLAGLALIWRGTAGYDDLKWSEYADDAEAAYRAASDDVRDGENQALPLPLRWAAARRGASRD
jgi:hypothetical protein